MIAEVIFRHVFCRKTAKNGVMIVLLMRQHNLSYFQLFNCRINKIRFDGCGKLCYYNKNTLKYGEITWNC